MRNILDDDDFGVMTMTESINNLQVVPSRIGAMNLFQGGGISETVVGIEQVDQELHLIPAAERGTMPEYGRDQKRVLRAIRVPHLPKNDHIIADSLTNVRQFGTNDTVEGVASVVAAKLQKLRNEHETTWEYHRIGALQGTIKDADGSTTLIDMFSEFAVTRVTVTWTVANANGLKIAAQNIIRKTEEALKLSPYTEIQVMCGQTFWDALIVNAETKAAFDKFQDGEFLRQNPFTPFRYAGLAFSELRGKVGSNPVVPAAEAFSFPVGVPGLYEQAFAPGTFVESVGTIGLPFYAKQATDQFGTRVNIHTQSNPLFLVKRPLVLIKIVQG